MQSSSDPFDKLAVYQAALRYAWSRFDDEELSNGDIDLESDESYQRALVLAWRVLRNKQSFLAETLARSPRLRKLRMRVCCEET